MGMSDSLKISPRVQDLLNRGIMIPCPYSVEVDSSINPEKIAPGVIIHTGCRITGAETSIGPGSEIGKEAPATIEDCQLGHRVELKGGYFSGATFLDGANMGSSAHVRPGTLLEEEAGGAHSVGFKQTIFLSFVTAGSLINFCDALMAGGTSRKNHSEIGSSFIHFNFTPHQDKATPSLVGDVPCGVFLDQPPIFLGGQGGLVGPARIAYGIITAAGTICRQDILEERKLFFGLPPVKESRPFAIGIYRDINRIVANNLIFIGNLWALKAWYQFARTRSMTADVYTKACHAGALVQIEDGLKERIKRLKELAGKMRYSLKHALNETGDDLPPQIRAQQQGLIDRWPEMEAQLEAGPQRAIASANRDSFLTSWEQTESSSGHINAVNSLSSAARKAGTAWLQEIVDSASALWTKI
jgi:bifunctional UDP-N-acetylglucosamine pyrophosphorylase / glucosamine-1-phosphate N-acetyltransferase